MRKIRGLEGAGEDLYGIVLSSNFGEGFWAATKLKSAMECIDWGRSSIEEPFRIRILFLDPWLQPIRLWFYCWCLGGAGLGSGSLPCFDVEEVGHYVGSCEI